MHIAYACILKRCEKGVSPKKRQLSVGNRPFQGVRSRDIGSIIKITFFADKISVILKKSGGLQLARFASQPLEGPRPGVKVSIGTLSTIQGPGRRNRGYFIYKGVRYGPQFQPYVVKTAYFGPILQPKWANFGLNQYCHYSSLIWTHFDTKKQPSKYKGIKTAAGCGI